MINQRKEYILKVVIGKYISTGMPVSSDAVASVGLGLSSATIRNEMLELEEEGYLSQPHTSAGRIPSDKGYRHYIESLMGDVQLTAAEQHQIRREFQQVEGVVEEWIRIAAAILSRTVHSVAIATLPKPSEYRLKHLELVSLQEFLALLVLVFKEAKIKHQVLTLEEPITQEKLSIAAQRLNAAYCGLAGRQIASRDMTLSPIEDQVIKTIVHMMEVEEEEDYEEPYVDGLRHILGQPEFATGGKLQAFVELLEEKRLLKALLPQLLTGEGVQVVIGREHKQDAIRGYSVVISRYGIPGEIGGAIGVVGPTRMQYSRAIPTVCFLSSVMSEMVSDIYG